MKSLIKRLKNLWELSTFRIEEISNKPHLKKDFATVQKKMAVIIPEKVVDVFDEQFNNGKTN